VIALLVSAGTMLLLDQCSKTIVQLHLANRSLCCGPLFRLRYVQHVKETYRRRVARTILVLVWFGAFVSAAVLRHSGRWFQAPFTVFGLGLAFGGAAGNLLDILRLRHIVDFIDLRWWPVFNLADLAIVAGLVLAFWRQV
jgi:signal peptidase II